MNCLRPASLVLVASLLAGPARAAAPDALALDAAIKQALAYWHVPGAAVVVVRDDRIVYLAEGRAASGPVDEVVRGDVLSRLYGHHVDVLRVHGRVLVVAGATGSDHDPGAEDRGHVQVVT